MTSISDEDKQELIKKALASSEGRQVLVEVLAKLIPEDNAEQIFAEIDRWIGYTESNE